MEERAEFSENRFVETPGFSVSTFFPVRDEYSGGDNCTKDEFSSCTSEERRSYSVLLSSDKRKEMEKKERKKKYEKIKKKTALKRLYNRANPYRTMFSATELLLLRNDPSTRRAHLLRFIDTLEVFLFSTGSKGFSLNRESAGGEGGRRGEGGEQ